MSTWLITGSSGQLGAELVRALAHDPTERVVGLTRAGLDVTDPSAVRRVVDQVRPDVIVNCAAYTAVDAAESDADAAMAVNGVAPGHLAVAAAACGSRLIQLSTDYVFSGGATSPYAEDAPTDPRSVYGVTKLAGERAVLDALPESGYVVRTAWLYGGQGPNFVRTMLRLATEQETLEVVDDQFGQPTWARDLAAQVVALGRGRAAAGVYHGTNAGSCTWFGFAREVFALAGLDPTRIRPTTSDRFPRAARRPAYSVLGHDRWARAGLTPLRHWTEALGAFMRERGDATQPPSLGKGA